MGECKHIDCNKAVTGKALFCSDRCRKAHARNSDTIARNSDTTRTNSPDTQLGQIHADKAPQYATRANPDKLNWDKWLNADQLRGKGLTANRVPIPGDYDYQGVS